MLQCDQLLESYTKYCMDQKSSQEYVRNQCQKNKLFQSFVTVSILSSAFYLFEAGIFHIPQQVFKKIKKNHYHKSH